jgi:hypothetical protein
VWIEKNSGFLRWLGSYTGFSKWSKTNYVMCWWLCWWVCRCVAGWHNFDDSADCRADFSVSVAARGRNTPPPTHTHSQKLAKSSRALSSHLDEKPSAVRENCFKRFNLSVCQSLQSFVPWSNFVHFCQLKGHRNLITFHPSPTSRTSLNENYDHVRCWLER